MYISAPPPKDPIPLASVPRTVQWDPPPFCTVNDSISLRGKSPQTSEFITKKLSGLPAKIWSRKWYSPPAVPRAVYSCKYLQDKYKYKKKSCRVNFKLAHYCHLKDQFDFIQWSRLNWKLQLDETTKKLRSLITAGMAR